MKRSYSFSPLARHAVQHVVGPGGRGNNRIVRGTPFGWHQPSSDILCTTKIYRQVPNKRSEEH